jgi:hypothetical protein
MTHYQDRHTLYEGDVIVFRRGDAISKGDKRFWQARFKIDGQPGFKTLSLKTRNRDDAIAKAKATYLRLAQSVRDGVSLSDRTFQRAWLDWYSCMVAEDAGQMPGENGISTISNATSNRILGRKN